METLAAEMICGSLPVPTASLPQFLACWGARFPAMTREKSALLGYLPCPALSLVCLGFCRPSSDACLCVPPPGLVGLLHFYLFSHPFSRAVPDLALAFLGKSSVTTCVVVPVLQNQQEQDEPERIQGASKPRDLPAAFLQVSDGIPQVWS